MSEQDNNTIDNNDVIEELPAIETPIKIKKPVTAEKLEQLKKARLVGAEKKKEMKELKIKAKQLPIEEYKLSAMKYDQLQKQKEDLIKPKEDIIKIKEEIQEEKPKIKDKKKRIIKKIIYEDGSEDEVEDLRHIQPKQIMNPYMSIYNNNQESYSNLVYQSACDKLKEKVQDERTKYLISSLMPNYG
jgi:hypothetical protein